MRPRLWVVSFALAASLQGLVVPKARADDPSNRSLVLAGLGLAVPTYFVGVAIHEGSHALAAKITGATVVDMKLLPHVHRGHFYFGRVQVVGLRSRPQRAFFLLAPKLSDIALVTTYATLLETGALPRRGYGLLGFTVLATGAWVDFTRDLFAYWDHNDTVKVYNAYGLITESQRLPVRLVHAGLSAAMAFAIVKGYQRVFDSDQSVSGAMPLVLPLWQAGF